jgi:Zn-dependent peptidase ImmA (M78 family)
MSDFAALAELDNAVGELLMDLEVPRAAPMPLDAVAEAMGLRVVKTPGAAEGRLCLRGGRATIEITPWGSVARQRFTLAHELGHAFLLHPARSMPTALCQRWPTQEAFCNDFAASLLLPRPWLEAHVPPAPSLRGLLWLAHVSEISPLACSLRLLRTGLWSSGLLSWLLTRGTWQLRGAAGLRSDLRRNVQLSPTSARRLRLLSGTSGHPRLRLHLSTAEHTSRQVDAEVSVGPHQCLALVPLTRAGNHWSLRWAH